jgi:probable rRNA maturation factor
VNPRITVQCVAGASASPSAAAIRRWALAALAGVRRRRVAVNVRIVGAGESRRLNAGYRRRDKATNVLSFPYEAPPGAKSELLGDLVICAPVVKSEARAQGKSEAAHWAHMVVHGIMHLRGYGHDNDEDAAVMERREIRILRALGFPNPYA